MDETELDRDIVIQRYSADLIADFDRSLEPFLRKPNGELRTRVRERETSRLVSQVLEPFQELPQLLDPHLPKYIPLLAEAYLGQVSKHRRTKSLSLRSQLLTPLSNAICRIIYAFCKIRSEKVIVRFLNVETRYLEPLLYAIEDSSRQSGAATNDGETAAVLWTWHERYVILLWLSQLFFAPFDLSTISSGDTDDTDRPVVPGFSWPAQVPGITLRVIPLGIRYLASPGKERDGAKALLVRLAMRKDMQEIGILKALVRWALSTLRPAGETADTPYYYIGSLSLLAGILRSSADTSIMDPYLNAIFYAVQAVSSGDDDVSQIISGSALARKMMIKVVKSVIGLVLRKPEPSMEDTEMVETAIGYLLESLADNDTPVRFAASKALSVITLKLESDMALQVVEAVLEALNRNVLWVKSTVPGSTGRVRDLTAVDPLEWHGLMLTLSHLLYRRSPPPEILPDIIHALIMGLSFEKRGTAGGSTGTNVRDAACFGIWALGRRYTTQELLKVPMQTFKTSEPKDSFQSVIQVLAIELVVAASLDPAGNIRRGSSAALQELIGRHPDTVDEGIAVVQAIDYHSVALRSRAIHDVALRATRLSTKYGHGILEALLGWRGIGDADAAARRVAATSFGNLTAETGQKTSNPVEHFNSAADLVLDRISALQTRQVEDRHGLLLSLAALFDTIPALLTGDSHQYALQQVHTARYLDALTGTIQDYNTVQYRKPELVAEAVARLVVSSYPILLAGVVGQHAASATDLDRNLIQPGPSVTNERQLPTCISTIETKIEVGVQEDGNKLKSVLPVLRTALLSWLNKSETEVVDAAAPASTILLLFSKPEQQVDFLQELMDVIKNPKSNRKPHGHGYYFALAQAYHVAATLPEDKQTLGQVIETFSSRWSSEKEIESRVALLQSLGGKDILRNQIREFIPMISAGLDDYTTNARGDIGSHVRLEALKATRTIWESFATTGERDTNSLVLEIFPKVLRLAAEKLDRVRIEAQATLGLLLSSSHTNILSQVSFSSRAYFIRLFNLCKPDQFNETVSTAWTLSESECVSSLLAGLATSADTGNEDLVIASRAAVAEICRISGDDLSKICMALFHNLKLYQGQDRVVVPTLELVAYLFQIGAAQRCRDLNLRQLCLVTQKAGYKTGNVRKLEACIKVYGGIASTETTADEGVDTAASDMTSELGLKRKEGIAESRRRLGALLVHPWPRVRNLVIDELWGLLSLPPPTCPLPNSDVSDAAATTPQHVQQQQQARREKLLSVDWGKADKTATKTLVGSLGLD
ncbi:DNA-directed RNA polymerases II 24 kDa polypeptide (RNA polymerase II subunit 5) [Pestalotiopsis sp. IQ-011]